MEPESEQDQIRSLVQRINEAWLFNYPKDIPAVLAELFDERMVIKGAAFETLGTGKAVCIQSYVDFVSSSKVRGCTFSIPAVEVTGNTAVASYTWDVTYEHNGKEHRDTGKDLLVFSRDGDGPWLAVWRALLPDPKPDSVVDV